MTTLSAAEALSQANELDAVYRDARTQEYALADALDDAKSAYDQATQELSSARRDSGLGLARIVREVGPDLILNPEYKALAERVYRYIRSEDTYGYPAAIVEALNAASASVAPVSFNPGQSMESVVVTTYTDEATFASHEMILFIVKAYENYRATQYADADLIVQVAERSEAGTRWKLRAAMWKAGKQWVAHRVDGRNFDQEVHSRELYVMVQNLLAIGRLP